MPIGGVITTLAVPADSPLVGSCFLFTFPPPEQRSMTNALFRISQWRVFEAHVIVIGPRAQEAHQIGTVDLALAGLAATGRASNVSVVDHVAASLKSVAK